MLLVICKKKDFHSYTFEAFHMKCQHQITKIRWQDHIRNSEVGSHHMPPELRLRSHCQASWRHASPPSTLVLCRSDSRPSSQPKLEASASYAGTTTRHLQLTRGEDPPHVVICKWRYGPRRLHVDDEDDTYLWCHLTVVIVFRQWQLIENEQHYLVTDEMKVL